MIMNLADPELELIDPTPNVHSLFVHFDELFFFTKLIGRALVRWSKRMYSCAGICSYEGKNGICNIALSEPLLKLRPRKDLIETLLHEMIHAYLFITNRDNDRDGHGPNFQAHMHRINRQAGLNITIYHDFHDEVKLYLNHWWRCNGICQKMGPYFGLVRRSLNRAPGPYDRWWESHKRKCGGTFIKIKEPQQKPKSTKKNEKGKINADITKYINNNGNIINKNINKGVNKENKTVNRVKVIKPKTTENILKKIDTKRRNSGSVIEKVRDVWANKQIPSVVTNSKVPAKPIKAPNEPIINKHKAVSKHTDSPPKKIQKIDDYFKITASSLLKDLYGKEFLISQSSNSSKLKAVSVDEGDNSNEVVIVTEDLVSCPSCNANVSSKDINRHLDECLNKDVIATLSKEFEQTTPITSNRVQTSEDKRKLKDIVGQIPKIPSFTLKTENKAVKTDTADMKPQTYKDLNKVNNIGIKNKTKTDLIIPKTDKDYSNLLTIKSEPSTSKGDYIVQMCPCCGHEVDKPIELHLNECLGFFNNNVTVPGEGTSFTEPIVIEDIKVEPGTSTADQIQKCPCCGETVDKPIEIHLDECLGFFNNDTTLPEEGASAIETIIINDDDDDDVEFDETQTLNATGTKSPCPCCLKMVEIAEMHDHLDVCIFN